MTAIAIWLNNEDPESPALWVASDSRVSRDQKHTLIDDAAKVFALPVVCRFPGESGSFTQLGYFHAYGYCFAGSTLLGQNTFLALMPLLSNLAATQGHAPPMADVADFILNYLGRAFDDYKAIARESSAIEVALFGWCHSAQKQRIFHFFPDKDENGVYVLRCTDHVDLHEKSFLYLGDHKSDMMQKIQKAFDGDCEPGRPLSRIPRYVIEEHIHNDEYKAIGGSLQLGIADRFGFRPFSICKPRVHGEPEAYLSYLGHELHKDIQRVGNAFVNLPAMA